MKYTKQDAFDRVLGAKAASLAPDRITREYLYELRNLLNEWVELVDEAISDMGG